MFYIFFYTPLYINSRIILKSARISEEDADDFKKNVLLPLRVAKIMPYVMIGLGGLFLVIAVIIVLFCRSNTRKIKKNGERMYLKYMFC